MQVTFSNYVYVVIGLVFYKNSAFGLWLAGVGFWKFIGIDIAGCNIHEKESMTVVRSLRNIVHTNLKVKKKIVNS